MQPRTRADSDNRRAALGAADHSSSAQQSNSTAHAAYEKGARRDEKHDDQHPSDDGSSTGSIDLGRDRGVERVFDVSDAGYAIELREGSGCGTLGGEHNIGAEGDGGGGIDAEVAAGGEGEGRAVLGKQSVNGRQGWSARWANIQEFWMKCYG